MHTPWARGMLCAPGRVHPPTCQCAVAQSITIQFESGMEGTYELESLRHLWPVIEAPTP